MKKLYYSITEVSKMLGISASNLRYWEKEFHQLNPKRNAKGTRFYTQEDIDIVKQIMFLVHNQNLTLEGARQKLSQKKDHVAKQQEIIERLQRVRAELKGIARALD
ncbi:MAG TPA: MerR family transcriptional regulator [Paludibacter sp.]|nr:MAG: HTH-type transcriptional regulator ZntR [Bacteroidetes bacterium ADurb.Bin174]HQB28216.1 MerR family transcriptional regulator [Paludibacter sp.]